MRISARRPGRAARIAVGLLFCGTVLAVTAPLVAAVPPPPPNPSDGDIAAAGGQVDAGVDRVGELINQVATADQELARLDTEVAGKREAVNKALVDLQNARTAADTAAATAAAARTDLESAGTEVSAAQGKFDRFAVDAYTHPGASSMVNYLAESDPRATLDRAELLAVTSRNQQAAIDGLRRAQVERANADSAAREAKQRADAAAAQAADRKDQAQAAVAAAKAALDEQAQRRDTLTAQRESAQQQLDRARSTVAGLQGQRDAYLAWDRRRQAELAAARTAAAAAAARAAADQAARDRAAELGAGHRPHTQIDNSPPPRRSMSAPSRPTGSRSELIETVVDRAMSQLGVTYAWGGGDEDGPTKGIHDGGVADSYGDYDKVGFDCSGLMVYAFAGVGISLPHYSGYQYTMGTRVDVDDRERGDMLFWGANGSEHVALYLGDGKMLEAPESGDVVKISAVREGGIMPYAVRLIG
ncbi:NlpC/P60 family protein [Nocardia vermiculata]|uniref:C40 family peptidase n=2 Tax=Nocardia vermiculata TaxID=257274 RepID=A0A846Y0J5_9NOCA|nr:NlpC/P60 family protein [Nocardia vermiculata]NKY50798.1 C40 family peptidase [Nocardia vermiculata]